MSVTDQQPTKVGQRVQEIFADSRGWVVELGRHEGQDCAVVEWDNPEPDLGADDSVFPLDALRVVEVICLDADHFEDPAMHPQVEVSYTPEDGTTNYVLKDGYTLRGTDAMRRWLLEYHRRA